jgi:hypothetical protein
MLVPGAVSDTGEKGKHGPLVCCRPSLLGTWGFCGGHEAEAVRAEGSAGQNSFLQR